MPRQSELTVSLANRLDQIGAMTDRVEAFLTEWEVDPEQVSFVLVMLDEIASNIIRSAWPDAGPHYFTVALRIERCDTGMLLTAEVVDDGIEFDPTAVPAPDLTDGLEKRQPGGLGLFMLGVLSDSLTYRREAGHNHLLITKQLQRA